MEEEKLLARKIFKQILKKEEKPSFKGIAMHLDSKVAVIKKNERSKSFDKWLKLSTLEETKSLLFPIEALHLCESD